MTYVVMMFTNGCLRSGQVRSGQVRLGQVRSECLMCAHSEQVVVAHACHGHTSAQDRKI